MAELAPAPQGSDLDMLTSSKGLLRSLSEGVRNLLVLDEKLLALGKEGDRTRAEIKALQENVFKLLGKVEEMDKRIGDRFSDLDKRLSEVDKRTALCVELEIRKQLGPESRNSSDIYLSRLSDQDRNLSSR